MLKQTIQTAAARKGSLRAYLKRYHYQPDLTRHLDDLPEQPFSQATVNEIVLWKVNRYVRLPSTVLDALYALRKLAPKEHRQADRVLTSLLNCNGVDLPMASTLLRFQNADVFQIIDRHAYRAVYGDRYPVHSATSASTKREIYFNYLDALRSLARTCRVAFRDLDRILYVFDKDNNGAL